MSSPVSVPSQQHQSTAFVPTTTSDLEKSIESRVSLSLEKKIEDKLTKKFLGEGSQSIVQSNQAKTPIIDGKKGIAQLSSGSLSESSIEDMTARIQSRLEATLEKNIEQKIEESIMTKIQSKIENKIEQEILQKMDLGMPTTVQSNAIAAITSGQYEPLQQVKVPTV